MIMNLLKKWCVYLVFLMLLVPFSYAELSGATPEAYSFARPPGESVSLFTGDMSLGVPVMTVPGRGGLNYPITLSYAAGIKVGQEASWVGLGWNFAPGAITRSVNGIPDDYITNSRTKNYAYEKQSITPQFADDVSNAPDNFFGTEAKQGKCDVKNSEGTCILYGESPESGGGLPGGSNSDTIISFAKNIADDGAYKSLNGFLHLGEEQEPSVDDLNQIDRLNQDSYSINGLGLSGSLMISGTNIQNKLNREFHMRDSSGAISSSGDDPIKIEYFLVTDDDESGNRPSSKGTIKSFTITTKDGTKFYYDYPVYNVNKEGRSADVESVPGLIADNRDTKPIIDKDYVSVSYSKSESGNSKFIQYFTQKFAYAWLLTAIVSPNYVDSNNNGIPDNGDKGNWIKFNYGKVYSGANSFEYRTPFGGGGPSADRKSRFELATKSNCPNAAVRDVDQQSCSETFSHGYMEIAYLDSVETPTHKAQFITSDRDDNVGYDFEKLNFIGDKRTKKLDSVKLLRDTNLVSEIKFTYDYSLNQNIPNHASQLSSEDGVLEGAANTRASSFPQKGRLTLKGIQQFDKNGKPLPATTFYYPGSEYSDLEGSQTFDSSDNPGWLGLTPDQYRISRGDTTDYRFDSDGYFWLGGTTQNHYIGDRRLNDAGRTEHINPLTGVLEDDTIDRKTLANVEHADAWSLVGVCWPSGSCTKYNYEIDRYGITGVSRTTGAARTGNLVDDADGSIEGNAGNCLHYGGGIRVKEIGLYSNGFSGSVLAKKFYYRTDEVLEDEKIPNQQFYISLPGNSNCPNMKDEDGVPLSDGSTSSGVLSYRPYSIQSNFNPNFVGYSKIIEKVGDGNGYTVHEFTTAQDYPPVPLRGSTTTKSGTHQTVLNTNFEDTSALWGLEKSTKAYDNSGNLVSQSTTTYDTSGCENPTRNCPAKQTQGTWADVCGPTDNCYSSDFLREEKVIPYWIKPLETESITDGVSVTTKYAYNDVNGMQNRVEVVGDASQDVPTKITTTEFAFEDEYPKMKDAHILDRAYETKLYKDSISDGNFVTKARIIYHNDENKGFPVKATAAWKDDAAQTVKTWTQFINWVENIFNLNCLNEPETDWVVSCFNRYDDYGNLLETTDPLGRKTFLYYGDNNDPENGAGLQHAYLTKGRNTLDQFMLTKYDPAFGVVTEITDFNNQKTNYEYDSFGRLKRVVKDGINLNEYSYDDISFDWRESRTTIDAGKVMELKENYDGLARPYKAELEDGGRKIVAETDYDPVFIDKVRKVTVPHFESQPKPEKDTYTFYEDSPLGRVIEIDPPGAGDIKIEYGSKNDKMATVVTTDELERKRAAITDIYGNLREVIEPLP